MPDRISSLVDHLSRTPVDDDRQPNSGCDISWIAHADTDEVSRLLSQLAIHAPFAAESNAERLVEQLLSRLAQRRATSAANGSPEALDAATRDGLSQLYHRMGADSSSRHHLLSILTHARSANDLTCFAELISSDPPHASVDAASLFFALTRLGRADVSALFPTLLEGLEHAQLAAPILDLTNFYARDRITIHHPATGRAQRLTELLGTVVGQLARWEENLPRDEEQWQQARDQVNDGIALAVSLCDTLSFIGDSDSIGKLNQALELGHRRVRVEAAAALSRLGEARGTTELARMAEEPISRLRVLKYAEELEIGSKIDPQFTSAEARAEAEIVCFLAEPTHFGISPQTITLIDQRNQYWPGFEEPVECYLFQYEYRLPQGKYSNIGIAGPLVQALTADLADLSLDNIYAAYAGAQTEHDEILDIPLDQLSHQQKDECSYLQQVLEDAGYGQIDASVFGIFFGEPVLVATATKDDFWGTVVTDGHDLYWYPDGGKSRPLESAEAYAIYKGRKMLDLFNPE